MRIGLVIGLILAAIVARWLPHPPNFTPIIGLSLFVGYIVPSRLWAVTATIAVMVLSDLLIGWHSMWYAVYGSLALAALFGRVIENRFSHVLSASVVASIVFFVLSNFAMWLTGYYGLTFEGLVACYIAAIPFFTNTLASTLLSSAVLFGAWYWVSESLGSSSKSGDKVVC